MANGNSSPFGKSKTAFVQSVTKRLPNSRDGTITISYVEETEGQIGRRTACYFIQIAIAKSITWDFRW